MLKARLFTAVLLVALSPLTQAEDDPVVDQQAAKGFIQEMVKKHAFDREKLQKLFTTTKMHQSILDAISRPAESKPWHQYRPIFLTRDRIRGGIRFWKENAAALSLAAETYGVPEEIIVAIIGVETRYGKHKGRYPVLESLATLAFHYPPRGKFFRSELEQYLLMCREENLDPAEMKGSYAGAMGLPQFISSSFRRYAVDFDKDGHRDLWNNPTDAIGSVANYFRKHRWQPGQPVAHRVQVHGKRFPKLLSKGLKPTHDINDLLLNGVVLPSKLPDNVTGRLFELETMGKPEYWVGWDNFYVITRYNHSALYSMAVYQLSQKIRKGYLGE